MLCESGVADSGSQLTKEHLCCRRYGEKLIYRASLATIDRTLNNLPRCQRVPCLAECLVATVQRSNPV